MEPFWYLLDKYRIGTASMLTHHDGDYGARYY